MERQFKYNLSLEDPLENVRRSLKNKNIYNTRTIYKI